MMYLVEKIPLHSPCRQKMDNLPEGDLKSCNAI